MPVGEPEVSHRVPHTGRGSKAVTAVRASRRLRTGSPQDAPALACVFIAAWQHAYPGLLPERLLASLDEEEMTTWLSDLLASGESSAVVAEDDNGAALGFCRYGEDPDDAGRGHIFSLYVLPSVAGEGVGSALCSRALDDLREKGLEAVTLWVFEGNQHARRFYTSFGFSPTGERRVEAAYGAEEVRLSRP